MEIKVFNNVFENKFETFEYNTTKPLLEQIEAHIEKETYRQTMVECYDSETGETFYAPMLDAEIEDPSVMLVVNGNSVDKDYEPKEGEIVSVIFLPANERAGQIVRGAIIGAAIGVLIGGLIITGGLLIAAGAGMFASSATASIMGAAGWIIGGLGVAGAIAGGFIGNNIYERKLASTKKSKTELGQQGSQSPDVRGAENSSLRGNNFPFLFGKHLITPFVIGDPITEYSGDKGEDAYINILLCAGYAPLKLTKFKLGEFWLAYNEGHWIRNSAGVKQWVGFQTLLSGKLKGYSYGGSSDNGDILDYWKNNDISLEIIQQPLETGEAVTIDDIYQEHTTIDLANRPQIPAATMQAAGWTEVESGSYCTVYSQGYSTEDERTTILVTPILSDGTVLTPAQLDTYADQILEGQTIDVDILLCTFNGSDSIEQSEEYAQGLHENQEAYYNQAHYPEGVNYGTIYPYAMNDQQINANVFYIADKLLDETAQVTYKGSSFPNNFRTNGVWFTDSCPMEFTLNIDFPSGLYRTYSVTETSNNSSTTTVKYATIPMWVCAQWRIYNNTNASSDPTGKDYNDWNNIVFYTPDGEHTYTGNFSYAEANFDRNRHKGNTLPGSPVTPVQGALNLIYGSFIGKNLQNFTSVGGNNGISEIRLSAKVTLSNAQIAALMADTNPGHLVEVRVLRVSPNYMNQTSDTDSSEYDTNTGMESYSDLLKVTSIVTKSFDEETYIKTGQVVPIRPLKDDDYRKLCLVAIRAKADASGYLANQLSQINCMAESFSPIWQFDHIEPTGVYEVKKYYGYFDQNDNPVNRSNAEGVTEREVTRAEYEEARQAGYNWYREDKGTNFSSVMRREVFTSPTTHNGEAAYYLQTSAKKYNNNSVVSSFLLACVGPQSGPVAVGYEGINCLSISDWRDKSLNLRDGTTANRTITYNGHTYNKDDIMDIRMEANGYVYSGMKFEDLLQKIAFCGRAVWCADDNGKIKVIMDTPVDYPVGVINAQNCISSSNTFNYEELVAGYQVSFSDENDGYEQNQFYVWADGNDAQSYHGQVSPVSVDFVTNNYQMYSLGRYMLAATIQAKEVLTRKIGPEGKLFHLGDVVLVQSEDLLIGDCSGRVQEVIEEGDTIYGFVCDAPYEYKAEQSDDDEYSTQGVTILQPGYLGKSNTVTLPIAMPKTQPIITGYDAVTPEGNENPQEEGWYELSGTSYILTEDTTVVSGKTYYEAVVVEYTLQKGTTNIVLFGTPVTRGSADTSATTSIKYNLKTTDICMFGLRDKISAPYRITKIKPEKDGCFTETLVPYDESLYNAGAELPSFQNYITPPEVVEPPISLIEGPSSVGEVATSQTSITRQIDNLVNGSYEIEPPDVATGIIATAEENGIRIIWTPLSSTGQRNVIHHYTVHISKDGGTTWTFAKDVKDSQYYYTFQRTGEGADGYPTSVQLRNWYVKISSVNIYGRPAETEEDPPNYSSSQQVDVSNYGSWVPATPVVTEANADRDGISIKFTIETFRRYGDKKYEVFVTHDNVDYPVAILGDDTARYTFNRGTDGYPEASDFANWTVTVKNSNEVYPSGQTSSPYTVTANGYKTWIIPQVTVLQEVVDRTIVLTATFDNVEVYGNIQTLVKIKRVGNLDIGDSSQTYNEMFITPSDSDWFTPEFTKNVGRTVTADAQAFRGDTEWNYKAFDSGVPKTDFYVSTSNKITHTLPLIGQNPRIYKLGNIPVLQPKEPSDPDVPYYEWLCVESLTMPASPIGEGEVVHYIGEANIEQGGVVVFASKGYYLATGAEVTPAGTENPQEEGWYAINDGKYELTTDTTVVSGTTYYEVSWEQVFCKSLAVNTTYQYMIGMTNEAYPVDSQTGEKTGVFASTVTATALPTNISDIVHSHEHYKNLYVEKLSAINANIGLISQGGMGSFSEQLNYWALSTMTAEESGSPGGVKKGAFRVGGVNEYFKVTPFGNDEYKIELKAGNIELTSTAGGGNGMDFLKGTFVYSQDKLQRLALTPEGILVQSYTGSTPTNPNPNDYTTTAQVTINSNNDMIISNSDVNPEFGHQVESTGAKIYHLDGNAKDEDGADPMGVTVSGSYVDNSANALLITNDRKCLEGTVVKTDMSNYTGQIAFVTMSEEVQIGDTAIKIDGTTESDIPAPLTGYNDAMRETSTISGYTGTVGSYLGLSESQVQSGIFF